MTKENFILTTYRPNLLNNYRYFEFRNKKYYSKDSTWSDELKKKFFSEGRRIHIYRVNTIKLKPDEFCFSSCKRNASANETDFLEGLKRNRR